MDIEKNNDNNLQSNCAFSPDNNIYNESTDQLSYKFQKAIVIHDHNDNYQNCAKGVKIHNPQIDSYITPEKINLEQAIPGQEKFQITKPKMRKETVEEDRFATPPRRPRCPTSEQMQYFLREERDGNRRR